MLAQDHRSTNALAGRVRSLAGGIGPAYPALAQQEARGAITAIDGLPALRSVAASSQIPSLTVIQEYAATINQLIALEDEIAAGSNDAALADTVRVVGLISAAKEEVSQEQAILTSALTADLVGAAKLGPGQLSAINAAQAQQAADLAQFGLIATPRSASCTTARCPRPRPTRPRRRCSRPSRWPWTAAPRRKTRPSPMPPTGPPTW